MFPTPVRLRCASALIAIACALSCAGSSSPVEPDSGDPGPSTPPPDPAVTISASALSLGLMAAEGSIVLQNLGPGAVSWTHQSTAAWMSTSPGSGTLAEGASVVVRIAVRREGLESGAHAGRVRFLYGDETLEVDVTLEVPPSALPMAAVSPASQAFGIDDGAASVYVTNAGGAPLSWSWSGPSWARAEPAAGTTAPGATTAVAVTIDRAGLPDGSHAGELALDSDGGSRTVGLEVQVASPARLAVSPLQVDFGSTGSAGGVTITNAGGRPLAWTASDDAGWLSLSPLAGSVPPGSHATLELLAARAGLTPGDYAGTVAVQTGVGTATVAVAMTVPAPDPAPPPPPPPPSSTALAGRVVDQFGGQGVAGIEVRFAGTTVTTGPGGAFAVPGSPSSSPRDLELSGPGVHPRATFARSGDTEWRIVPGSFPMGAFDDMAREYEPRTIRWMSSPNVYVDTRPEAFAGGPELAQWVTEAQSQAAAFVSEWTGGHVDPGSVSVGSSPPPDGTPGTIVIHFSEQDSRYGSPTTVGLARTFWTGDRSIAAAIIWLRFERFSGPSNAGIRRAVLGHELGHALGLGHMDGGTSSIMTSSVSSNTLTSFDRDAGQLLYTRSPGNTSPDVDNAATYRGSLAPSRAVGSYDWVCGAAPRP